MQLPEILASIPAARVAAMHARVVFIYENFLSSLARQVNTGPSCVGLFPRSVRQAVEWNSQFSAPYY